MPPLHGAVQLDVQAFFLDCRVTVRDTNQYVPGERFRT